MYYIHYPYAFVLAVSPFPSISRPDPSSKQGGIRKEGSTFRGETGMLQSPHHICIKKFLPHCNYSRAAVCQGRDEKPKKRQRGEPDGGLT